METKPNQKQKKTPKQRSPNLLQNVLQIRKKEKEHYKVSKFAFFLIVFIQTLFIFLSLYNSRTIALLEQSQAEINKLEWTVLSKRVQENKIRDVIKRTEKLKELERERVLVGSKIEPFVNKIPDGILLLKSEFEKNTIVMTIETDSPLGISFLIKNYFGDGFAKQIVIQNAILNRTKGKFTTTLEVLL